MNYANAANVLPKRLLAQVQKFHQGVLWVPVLERRRFKTAEIPERDDRIRRDRAGGMTFRALGEKYRLPHTYVFEICKRTCTEAPVHPHRKGTRP
jgi:hypothetical protein